MRFVYRFIRPHTGWTKGKDKFCIIARQPQTEQLMKCLKNVSLMSHVPLFGQEWPESNSKYLELMDSSDPFSQMPAL